MKSKNITAVFFVFATFFFLSACNTEEKPQSDDHGFSVAFITDIHLTPERNAVEGFRQVIDTINALNPDFVITGGDLIMDALGQSREHADSLYRLYREEIKGFKMPVHNTPGNHEVFGWYLRKGVTPQTPGFGKHLYEEYLGKRYYSFEHKGWKFFILDAVDSLKQAYYGNISADQMEWLSRELAGTDTLTPLVVVVHIPVITSQAQYHRGGLAANPRGQVIENGKALLELFAHHNLKLVLQGHLHFYEDIFTHNIHFITAGAVSGAWWQGPYDGTEEGFLMVRFKGDSLATQYIDYGWTPPGESSLPSKNKTQLKI